jgi:hypothetical protein
MFSTPWYECPQSFLAGMFLILLLVGFSVSAASDISGTTSDIKQKSKKILLNVAIAFGGIVLLFGNDCFGAG